MQPFEVLRSLLFVPANSPAKLTRARESAADALILDWEDGVAEDQKAAARVLAVQFLSDVRKTVFIRVNPVESSFFAEDMAAINERKPDGIFLSKCRSIEDVHFAEAALRKDSAGRECTLVPMVESAYALLRCCDIANCSPRVAALAFGAEDFAADLGITRTAGEPELLYARSALVTAARAMGRSVIDSPSLECRDALEVRAAARRARNLGFTGQLTIHPFQAPIVNEVFCPSELEIMDARKVIEAFACSHGGVTTCGGRMIDEAVVRRARAVLDRAVKLDRSS